MGLVGFHVTASQFSDIKLTHVWNMQKCERKGNGSQITECLMFQSNARKSEVIHV